MFNLVHRVDRYSGCAGGCSGRRAPRLPWGLAGESAREAEARGGPRCRCHRRTRVRTGPRRSSGDRRTRLPVPVSGGLV